MEVEELSQELREPFPEYPDVPDGTVVTMATVRNAFNQLMLEYTWATLNTTPDEREKRETIYQTSQACRDVWYKFRRKMELKALNQEPIEDPVAAEPDAAPLP